jgi:large subunit ribosomal protein L23
MSSDRLHRIIVAPLISEKTTRVAEKHNQAVFRVLSDARKPEIKAAVEKLFNVKVEAVRTLNVYGKHKRFGRFEGKRSNWKKAYVTLAEGQQIEMLAGGAA